MGDLIFNQIVAQALRDGIIDTFKVIAWFSMGTTQEMVVREIEEIVRARKQAS